MDFPKEQPDLAIKKSRDEFLQTSDLIKYRKTTGSQERGNLRVSGSKNLGGKKDSLTNLQQSQNGNLLTSQKFDGSFFRGCLKSEEGQIHGETIQEESNMESKHLCQKTQNTKSSNGLDFLDVKKEIQNELKQVDKKVIEKFARNQKKKVSYINTMNLIQDSSVQDLRLNSFLGNSLKQD